MSLLIPDPPTLFLNCRLIDGHGGEPVENAAVKVEGNLITAVGRTRRFRREPERQHARRRPRRQDAHARA